METQKRGPKVKSYEERKIKVQTMIQGKYVSKFENISELNAFIINAVKKESKKRLS